MKNVILITNSFPFGIVEAGFLAPEYEVLKENDAYHALEKVGGLIKTGPTGTNVNDVAVVLIG